MTLKCHILLSLVLVLVVSHVRAMFEDQAFKFDWRQQYVGHIKNLEFWEASAGSGVVIRTDSNVLALLDADSGHIKWRHIFADSIILESSLDAIDGKHLVRSGYQALENIFAWFIIDLSFLSLVFTNGGCYCFLTNLERPIFLSNLSI